MPWCDAGPRTLTERWPEFRLHAAAAVFFVGIQDLSVKIMTCPMEEINSLAPLMATSLSFWITVQKLGVAGRGMLGSRGT